MVMKKVKVRVGIKGDTEGGVLAPEECQQFYDQGMTGELEGVNVGSVEQLKSELELKEEGTIPEVIFMSRVSGG